SPPELTDTSRSDRLVGIDFLRKVLVGSPEMCMDSKDMMEHPYVTYTPLESEQARMDSAMATLHSRFNRLSREIKY
ncbi:hypothetical protein FRC00_013658, partial [Tulasnella sp. 408]